MEILSQYNTINSYKQLSRVGTEPLDSNSHVRLPQHIPEDELSPEEQLNQDREAQATQDAKDAEAQAKKDAQKDYAAGYLSHHSKQTQVEIYLSVATDSNVSLGSNTASIIESLRDVQQQNNRVEAYATYKENQENEKPALY